VRGREGDEERRKKGEGKEKGGRKKEGGNLEKIPQAEQLLLLDTTRGYYGTELPKMVKKTSTELRKKLFWF
jgi:hypothetical protein